MLQPLITAAGFGVLAYPRIFALLSLIVTGRRRRGPVPARLPSRPVELPDQLRRSRPPQLRRCGGLCRHAHGPTKPGDSGRLAIREQRRRATGVDEDDIVIGRPSTSADVVDQPRHSLAGVDGSSSRPSNRAHRVTASCISSVGCRTPHQHGNRRSRRHGAQANVRCRYGQIHPRQDCERSAKIAFGRAGRDPQERTSLRLIASPQQDPPGCLRLRSRARSRSVQSHARRPGGESRQPPCDKPSAPTTFEPPSGTMYGVRPSAASSSARRSISTVVSVPLSKSSTEAPRSRSSCRLPPCW